MNRNWDIHPMSNYELEDVWKNFIHYFASLCLWIVYAWRRQFLYMFFGRVKKIDAVFLLLRNLFSFSLQINIWWGLFNEWHVYLSFFYLLWNQFNNKFILFSTNGFAYFWTNKLCETQSLSTMQENGRHIEMSNEKKISFCMISFSALNFVACGNTRLKFPYWKPCVNVWFSSLLTLSNYFLVLLSFLLTI